MNKYNIPGGVEYERIFDVFILYDNSDGWIAGDQNNLLTMFRVLAIHYNFDVKKWMKGEEFIILLEPDLKEYLKCFWSHEKNAIELKSLYADGSLEVAMRHLSRGN